MAKKKQTVSWVVPKYRASPEDFHGILSKIEKDYGEVKPQHIVEEARDPESPIHDDFEWNDKKAAEKYRLVQASAMIRNLRVEVTVAREATVTRAYFESEKKHTYDSIVTVLSNESKKKYVLRQAYIDMKAFVEKYKLLEELAEIVDTVDGFLPKLKAKLDKLK